MELQRELWGSPHPHILGSVCAPLPASSLTQEHSPTRTVKCRCGPVIHVLSCLLMHIFSSRILNLPSILQRALHRSWHSEGIRAPTGFGARLFYGFWSSLLRHITSAPSQGQRIWLEEMTLNGWKELEAEIPIFARPFLFFFFSFFLFKPPIENASWSLSSHRCLIVPRSGGAF